MSRRSNLYPSAAGSSSSSSYTQKPYTPGGGQRTNGAYGNSNGSSSSQPPPLNGSNDHPTATNSAGSDYVPASNFNKTTYSKLTTTTTTIYSPTANTVDDYIQDETLYFEKSRIQQLRDERIHIQKKTFKKWCNSYLNKARMEINDLFTDFADGTVLIKFLEIISGEKFCKPNRGRMRVQKIENINKSLEFLKSKGIQLENIGAEDIHDGNPSLILGLIWTIILRFTIESIEIESKESGERKYAKEALLLWCQRKTAGYPNVKVDNFTTSWRNGLAFCALVHAHRPELIKFDSLNPQDPISNLNHVFDVAEKNLDIARLLDAEDVNVSHPDEKSIVTYVSLFYNHFAKQKAEMTGARRVGKVVGELVEQDNLQEEYEQICSDLLAWIQQTIKWLNNRNFPNGLKEMQEELAFFNRYRKEDKPSKYKEKGDLEALIFLIQTKRTAMRLPAYVPAEGLLLHDMNTAWSKLDHAENERQIILIQELQRQEKLELKAKLFYNKATVRDAWLRNMINVLANFECSSTANDVEKAQKMLASISTIAGPKATQFKQLSEMSGELQRDNYHAVEGVRQREREVINHWNQFLTMLHNKEAELERLKELTKMILDLDTLSEELKQLELQVRRGRGIGRHLLAVEDNLQKHELLETNITANGDWLKSLKRQAGEYIRTRGEHMETLQEKVDQVGRHFDALVLLGSERRLALNRARSYFLFVQNCEEELSWLAEKQQFCQQILNQRDISTVTQATSLYKIFESEMQAHWQQSKNILSNGETLLATSTEFDDIRTRVNDLQQRWDALRKIASALSEWLQKAEKVGQYFQDANFAESWIKEKMPLVLSDDFGKDVSTAEGLLIRHEKLEDEVKAYQKELIKLEELALQFSDNHFSFSGKSEESQRLEEIVVPKAMALYPYEGKGISVGKKEVLALIDNSNKDWWRVLKQDGNEGYIPANYCEIVPDETVMVKQMVDSGTKKPTKEGNDSILKRQESLSINYAKLNKAASRRHRLLNEAIQLFRFINECRNFEEWSNSIRSGLQESTPIEHVEASRNKFDKLKSEMNVNGKTQLNNTNKMADELIGQGEDHSKIDEVKACRRQMNTLWTELQHLHEAKSEELGRLTRLVEFREMCTDTRSWMTEKFSLLGKTSPTENMKELQALQRRYQNLERDMKPLKDRMDNLSTLGIEITRQYPRHKSEVDNALAELNAMYVELLRISQQKITEAEQSQGQQMFDTVARELLDWTNRMSAVLNEPIPTSAQDEEVLKHHNDIEDQIKMKDYEFAYVDELGRRLMKNKKLNAVEQKLEEVLKAKAALKGIWKCRDQEYRQLLELKALDREAERIGALTNAHRAFLDVAIVFDSVEAIENHMKSHADFESRLKTEEERVKVFVDNSDKLIKDGHVHANHIETHRSEVLRNRENVYVAATKRKTKLEHALAFENLRRNVNELGFWINAKKRIAADDSFKKDGAVLDRDLLKHQAFMAEIHSNSVQLSKIQKEADKLASKGNIQDSKKIKALTADMNENWNELVELATQKSDILGQANDRKMLLEIIQDANARLNDVEKQLSSKDYGKNLRATKDLIQNKNLVDQELTQIEMKVNDISVRGKRIIELGHYDADEITRRINELVDRFNGLKDPLESRLSALEESLKWFQLAFDADVEMQWIQEKKLIAESKEIGQTLADASNLLKKHDQLSMEVASHQVQIEALLSQEGELLRPRHPAAVALREKLQLLNDAWSNLSSSMNARKNLLKWGLQKEQYLFDLSEVEEWINERNNQLVILNDDKLDQLNAPKLMASVRTIVADMLVYKATLKKLTNNCKELSAANERYTDNAEMLMSRQEKVETDLAFLEESANKKASTIDGFIKLFELDDEARNFLDWIAVQIQITQSEEYGQDYEHLLTIKSKFSEFKNNLTIGRDRLKQFDKLVSSDLLAKSPFAREILRCQERVRSEWEKLLEHANSRELKLDSAEELHKFNRDSTELNDRLRQKLGSISDEPFGRDAKHAFSLIVAHEVFEKEITQLHVEIKLKKLMAEGERLQESYPGSNAENIVELLESLIRAWEELKAAAIARNTKLVASYDYHKFLAQVRDFITWTAAMNTEMQGDQRVRDLQTAEWFFQDHQRLCAEIAAREPKYEELYATGSQLLAAKHFASKDIEQRIGQIKEAYEAVKVECNLRNQWINQLISWHTYEREVRQIIAAIEGRERTLTTLEIGVSVQAVESQLRKFETFTKALSQLEERVAVLQSLAEQLLSVGHMETKNINIWRQKVLDDLSRLGATLDATRKDLEIALSFARFDSEVDEMLSWIEERRVRLHTRLSTKQQSLSLEEKLSQLNKQQALDNELQMNTVNIQALKDNLNQIRRTKVSNSKLENKKAEIVQRSELMFQRWKELNQMANELNLALKEAKDLFELQQSIQQILRYIREKEVLLAAEDVGADLEHCQSLIERITGRSVSDSNVTVDQSTLAKVNKLGEQIMRQQANGSEIKGKLSEVNNAWNGLSNRIQGYVSMLSSALEVHRFNRDVDETTGRIKEKFSFLSSDDYGKDLPGVEQLLRRHDEIEQDMSAIHQKLNEHDEEAKKLLTVESPLKSKIFESLQKLEVVWRELADLANERRNKLHQSLALHRYFDSVKKMEQWASDLRVKITSYIHPRSIADCQRLLKFHKERLVEIEARDHDLKGIRERGQKLMSEQPEHKGEVQRTYRRLQSIEHQIRQAWDQENTVLQNSLKLQTLHSQILQKESWIAGMEAFVSEYDIGDSIDSVENAIKKHSSVYDQFCNHSDRIDELRSFEAIFSESASDPEADRIKTKYDELLKRHETVLKECESKTRYLQEARKLQLFLRDCNDVIMWMNTKLQLAYDDEYIDLTHLRSKLKKHRAFDTELQASGEKIDSLREKGDQLIAEGNLDSERIKFQLDEVVSGWNELITKSSEKSRLLQNAYEAYQLSSKLLGFAKWLDQIEHSIASDDHGEDITSVEKLIKQHEEILCEIEAKRKPINEYIVKATELQTVCENEIVKEHMSHADSILQRYESLEEPCQIRADNLKDSLKFFQWTAVADEQIGWINDKIPQLESTNYGQTLHSAQSMKKKHDIFEQELSIREPHIRKLIEEGDRMHHQQQQFLQIEVVDRVAQMRDGVELIKALKVIRSRRINESLQSQEYYAEASEAELWIRERIPLASRGLELCNNQSSAEAYLRRLDALEQEIKTFSEQIRNLKESCNRMTDADHFDLTQLTARQAQLEEMFHQMSVRCKTGKVQVENVIQYFNFVRHVDDLISWMIEKKQLADREDYGTDLEDCVELIEQFEQVIRELAGSGERVSSVLKLQDELLSNRHPNVASIRAKGNDLQALWREVNDAANERRQALEDGKNIHQIDAEADELLNSLAEKECYIITMNDEDLSNSDAKTVEEYAKRHDDFLYSLYQLEKRIRALSNKVDTVMQDFPRTQDHLEVRRSELIEQLKDVEDGTRNIAERLNQAQKNQAYFQEFRDVMAWFREIQAKITGEILPRDVQACEALNARHAEYHKEIQNRETQKNSLELNGQRMIQQGNILSSEIAQKIELLNLAFQQLYQIWHRRQQIYDENTDVQQWIANATFLEQWLVEREQFLKEDWYAAESVDAVDTLIRRFDDFLITLDSQIPQFEALKRLTKLEESFRALERRERAMMVEHQPTGRRETQQIRTLEKKKILQEKRHERERRKTQEISLLKRSQDGVPDTTTLPRIKNRASSSASLENAAATGGGIPTLPVSRTIMSILPTSIGPSHEQSSSSRHSSEFLVPTERNIPKRVPSTRTPGFTTRRTQNVRRNCDNLKSIDMHGYIDRKHELQCGGKKATFRSWKSFYTILCGQLLCFFKDEQEFMGNMAAAPPIYIHRASCLVFPEYIKKRNVFKVNTTDGSEYLFSCEQSELKMIEWVDKINFHAQLDPALQLTSFSRSGGQPRTTSEDFYVSNCGDEFPARSNTLELRSSASFAYGKAAGANGFTLSSNKQRPASFIDSTENGQANENGHNQHSPSGSGSGSHSPLPLRKDINGNDEETDSSSKNKKRSAFSFLRRTNTKHQKELSK